MSNENNKFQIDIENLFKQNVNDLSAIKELYRILKEVEEKISQIKYIDSSLANKLKKEYEKLKRIILDENVQAKLANDIETINEKLTNDIETINEKLNNDVETINSQLDTIVNNQNALKVSNFGVGVEGLKLAIAKGNEKKIPVDIDIDITFPDNWSLTDMIDVKTNIFSSVGIKLIYTKYGIPIFLIKDDNIEFGKGIEFYWSGITPSNGNAPQSWVQLRTAMNFNVTYDYNRNTSTAPLVFLGVNGGKCRANFTAESDNNLIYNCIAVLPKTSTSRHSFYLDCVFDGIIFGLNSQNFNGLHGRVKGKRYGNLSSTGVAPGHLIYLTCAGDSLPVWSTDIDIYCDDTEAKCVTDGLKQDDVSLKFLSSESIRLFVASNRPHGALDLTGARDVNFTCYSDRQVNRKGTEYSPFAFRIQPSKINHQTTNTKDSSNIRGTLNYNIINDDYERGAILSVNDNAKINNTIIDFLCTCDENAKNIGTIAGSNSKYDFKIIMKETSTYDDDVSLINIGAYSRNEKLLASIEFLNEIKNRFRISQGNAEIGDVTILDKNSALTVDNAIKRIVANNSVTYQARISGASTTALTLPYYLATGNYEIIIESQNDDFKKFYKANYILGVKGDIYAINKVYDYGDDGMKWEPTISSKYLVITPSTTETSNYKVIINKH